MSMLQRLKDLLARFPIAAAVLYGGVVLGFLFTTLVTVLDLIDRHAAVAASADMLASLEGRGPVRPRAGATDASAPSGSPFVDGATVSVAGAALLQRVVAATTQVGANVLSSQVDLQGPQSKAGFVNVTASFEIEPTALQRLLYDLESGMPFLFVDQIDVQAPGGTQASASGGAPGKMRVQMTVSGQWQGIK
jgi:general secretion pathway protein M